MYKCNDCGTIFDNKTKASFELGYDPECDGVLDCPHCHSDNFAEVEKCWLCDNYDSNNFSGICEECEKKVVKDVKDNLLAFVHELEDYEVAILEEMLNELELTSLIRKIKLEKEAEENA